MGNSVRDWRVPFVQFNLTSLQRESGTSLTIGARPGTLVKENKWNTIFRLNIPIWSFGLFQDVPFISEIFPSSKPK